MGLSVGGSDGWMFDGANNKTEGGENRASIYSTSGFRGVNL